MTLLYQPVSDRRERGRSTSTSIGSRLRRFEGLKEEPTCQTQPIAKNQRMELLYAILTKFIVETVHPKGKFPDFFLDYNRALGELERFSVNFSAKEIELATLMLSKFECPAELSSVCGIFISALVNHSTDSEFVLRFDHLEHPPAGVGYYNTKTVTVYGEISSGFKLNEGNVLIFGNTESIGCMNCGTIKLVGDSHMPGLNMLRGRMDLEGRLIMRHDADYGILYGGAFYIRGKLMDSAPDMEVDKKSDGTVISHNDRTKLVSNSEGVTITNLRALRKPDSG